MSRMRWLIAAAIVAAALGLAALAMADEALAPGDYTLTVPGVGDITLQVTDTGTVDMVTVPSGYTVTQSTNEDEPSFQVFDAANMPVLTVKVDDGELEVKSSAPVTAGTYPISLPNGVTVSVIVADDGSVSVDPATLPDGTQVQIQQEDGGYQIELQFADGSKVKIELKDGTFKVEVENESDSSEVEDSTKTTVEQDHESEVEHHSSDTHESDSESHSDQGGDD